MAKYNVPAILYHLSKVAEIAAEDDNRDPSKEEVSKLADILFDKGGLESAGIKMDTRARSLTSMIRGLASNFF